MTARRVAVIDAAGSRLMSVTDGRLDARFLVGGQHHHAAAREVRADQRLHLPHRRRVQRRERLVEYP